MKMKKISIVLLFIFMSQVSLATTSDGNTHKKRKNQEAKQERKKLVLRKKARPDCKDSQTYEVFWIWYGCVIPDKNLLWIKKTVEGFSAQKSCEVSFTLLCDDNIFPLSASFKRLVKHNRVKLIHVRNLARVLEGGGFSQLRNFIDVLDLDYKRQVEVDPENKSAIKNRKRLHAFHLSDVSRYAYSIYRLLQEKHLSIIYHDMGDVWASLESSNVQESKIYFSASNDLGFFDCDFICAKGSVGLSALWFVYQNLFPLMTHKGYDQKYTNSRGELISSNDYGFMNRFWHDDRILEVLRSNSLVSEVPSSVIRVHRNL